MKHNVHYCPDCTGEGYPRDNKTQLKPAKASLEANRSLSYMSQVDELMRCPMCKEYYVLCNGDLAEAADWVIP